MQKRETQSNREVASFHQWQKDELKDHKDSHPHHLSGDVKMRRKTNHHLRNWAAGQSSKGLG